MKDDMISRQAAIDAICKACSIVGDYHKCDGYPETSTWCDELVALRAVPSAQPQWIMCSERLPEEDGQYLITVKYKHVNGYEGVYAEHGDWFDGEWDMYYCSGHCGEVEDIIAWMPLPEPCNVESEV